jgi:DNA-binding IscR family transcriptional regulator
MDNRVKNSRENRKAILREVGRALSDRALTKVELVKTCTSVHIDHNVLQMLKNAGVISSTRGRNSVIALKVSFMHIVSNLDTLAEKMHRSESYSLHQEKRVLEAKADLKAAFKRAKSETDYLREQLEAAQREIKRLSSINQALNEKLSAIKVILK